jgi:hypothetical protein
MYLQAVSGIFYRLHPCNPATGQPWPAVHFSRRGASRFDPVPGIGTLYLGDSLAGAVLETFGDQLDPAGSLGRAFSRTLLGQWFVSLISVPEVMPVAASGTNLSKLGVDLQLVTGDHATAREWALRFMEHPAQAEGIWYPSRHDDIRRNLALFQRARFLPAQEEAALVGASDTIQPALVRRDSGPLLYGPPVCLLDHPELMPALVELEIALLP